jgi:hypothetical protein
MTSAARDLSDNYFLSMVLHSAAHFLHSIAHSEQAVMQLRDLF